MAYFKSINNNYVIGIGVGDIGIEIAETEYNEISAIFHAMPTAPDGYAYHLRADTLEWELVELPQSEDEEATTEDYEAALAELGVK